MRKLLPSYYIKSAVMQSLFDSLEQELECLSNEANITQNEFFVILSERNLTELEQDVGLMPGVGTIDARRSNILSRLRGTGTTTKEALKNVSASFQGGEIEIIELASEYAFAVKFVSKKGTPVGLDDIKRVIDEIKPAHIEARYIFTYRLWDEAQTVLVNWEGVKDNTWDWIRSFEPLLNLYILDGKAYYRSTSDGNAYLIFESGKPYARIQEGGS